MKSKSGLLKNLSNDKIYLMLLCYVGFGILVFAARYHSFSSFDMMLYTISDPLFLLLFFFPTIIALSFHFYHQVTQVNFLLRFLNRKEYFKFVICEWLKLGIFYFGFFGILLLMANNLLCERGMEISATIGKPNNLVILFFTSLKLLLFALATGLFSLLLFFRFQNKNKNIVLLGITGCIIYSSSLIMTKSWWMNILLPINYISGWKAFPKLQENAIVSLLFYGLTFGLCSLVLYRIIQSRDMVGDEDDRTVKA